MQGRRIVATETVRLRSQLKQRLDKYNTDQIGRSGLKVSISDTLESIFDEYDRIREPLAPESPSKNTPTVASLMSGGQSMEGEEAVGQLPHKDIIRHIMNRQRRAMTAQEILPDFQRLARTSSKRPSMSVSACLAENLDLFKRVEWGRYELVEWSNPHTLDVLPTVAQPQVGGLRLSPLKIQAAETWLKCESTRDLGEGIGVTHTTANDYVEEVAFACMGPLEIKKTYGPVWSPICTIDATWISVLQTYHDNRIGAENQKDRLKFKKMCIIMVRDVKNDPINYKVINDERDKDDITAFLIETRDKLGYSPKYVIIDGNDVISTAAKLVFPGVVVGTCRVHLQRTIRDYTQISYAAPDQQHSDEATLPPAKDDLEEQLRHLHFRESLNHVVNSHTIMEFDNRLDEAIDEMCSDNIKGQPWARDALKAVLRQWDFLRATARFEESEMIAGRMDLLPRDTNGAENFFSIIEPRLTRSKGFKSRRTVEALINLIFGFERFHPSTASDDPKMRGKALIESAGVHLDPNARWDDYLVKRRSEGSPSLETDVRKAAPQYSAPTTPTDSTVRPDSPKRYNPGGLPF